MAWNQPGGSNGRDPWGGRDNQQGPPDLDEALKKLQAQWARLFGGKSGGGGGSRPGGKFGAGAGIGLLVILLVLLVLWGVAGIYIVEPAERGVVLRFGAYNRTTMPGPHWAPPVIERVLTVNVDEVRREEIGFRNDTGGQGSVPHESLMLTEDENIIDIKFAVLYRVKDAADYLFNVVEQRETLRQVTESAVREIVGRSGMDFVITGGRDAVAVEAQVLIQEVLDKYGSGIEVSSVNMQDAQPPTQVQNAFFDAVKAREDQERIINEANAYKADIVPKARGDANAISENAEAYRQRVIAQAEGATSRFLNVLTEYEKAPEVTRERLYLEAVESVMSNSSKVLVDVKGGNSLMYLPIDKLLGAAAEGGQSRGSNRETMTSRENSTAGSADSFTEPQRTRNRVDGRSR